MRIKFTMKDMDDLMVKHLHANLEYWKFDTLLEGRKAIRRIEKSRSLKVFSRLSAPVSNAVMLMKTRKDLNEKNIGEMIDYSVDQHDGNVFLEIFLSNEYFIAVDMLKAQAGKQLSRLMKVFDRQEFVDRFSEEIKNVYTKNYKVEIFDDDGQKIKL